MRKARVLAVMLGLLWGCVAFNQNYKLGTRAEMNQKYDEAIAHYEKAIAANPKESIYRLALFKARYAAALVRLQEARKLAAAGQKAEAEAEYNKALSYDPRNPLIADELRKFKQEDVKKPEPEKVSYEYPVKLKVAREKIDLNFMTDVSLRSIFQALGKHFEVNILFDELFKEVPLVVDLRGKEFEEAVNHLCLMTKHFYRIVDEKTIIVVPDRPEKRQQYDLAAIKTYYLSNINAQDIQPALTMMLQKNFRPPMISIDKSLNSITIRDAPSGLKMAEDLIRIWDKPKAEVVIDVEIMEVNRIKMKKLGIDFDQSSIALRYAGGVAATEPDDSTGWINLSTLNFSKNSNYELGLPTALLEFLEQDSDTKIIAQPRLRGIHDAEIKYIVGQKIPFINSQFNPIAAGGLAVQPVVNYTQQDVGIDITIRPRIHRENEITLEMEMKITSIAGTGVADIPILSTREVKNTLRLKDGETNLLAGLLKEEERTSLKGIAGLKDIPLLGRLFSVEDKILEQTDVILTLTPYIIRTVPMAPGDAQPLWVDMEGMSSNGARTQAVLDESLLRSEQLRGEENVPEQAGNNQVSISPTNFEVPVNREFRLSVNLLCEQPVANLSLNINFNSQAMKLKDVIEGGFIRQFGGKVPFLKNIDNSSGVCTLGLTSPDVAKGFKGGNNLVVLVFDAVAAGESAVTISNVTANASNGQMVQFQLGHSRVVIR